LVLVGSVEANVIELNGGKEKQAEDEKPWAKRGEIERTKTEEKKAKKTNRR
jgi:hypothetical protein